MQVILDFIQISALLRASIFEAHLRIEGTEDLIDGRGFLGGPYYAEQRSTPGTMQAVEEGIDYLKDNDDKIDYIFRLLDKIVTEPEMIDEKTIESSLSEMEIDMCIVSLTEYINCIEIFCDLIKERGIKMEDLKDYNPLVSLSILTDKVPENIRIKDYNNSDSWENEKRNAIKLKDYLEGYLPKEYK